MGGYVVCLQELDHTQVALAGSKGAHLGELMRIEGVRVPAGFCVTTDAFRRATAGVPSIHDRLDRLARLDLDDRAAIGAAGAEMQRAVEATPIPDEVAGEISRALSTYAEGAAFAVRSSATAEDLPGASFAGQLDTSLNVVGPAAVLEHVRRCWASLYGERAVAYRLARGFDHRAVDMAVVVQLMVHPEASGVLFTADPVTSNRKVSSVEAVFGLGEAFVSGLVSADVHKVSDDKVVDSKVATKEREIVTSPAGGTAERPVEAERQERSALSDEQLVHLAGLGRRIEAHFGCPQDIEWCLVAGDLHIVQSRPITTLFPIPEVTDQENHVYLSVGHQQMMTDPMKPLGLSLWRLTALPPMHEAGGRLFVDVTPRLASPASREGFLEMMGRHDPLTRDALETVIGRGDFIPELPEHDGPVPPPPAGATAPIEPDEAVVADLIDRNQASIAELKHEIRSKSGSALFDFILADIQELKRLLFDPRSHQVFMAAMEASWWLNEHLEEWLGEKSAADTLTQSVPHNVTSEMGLALLDVADAIRPHHDVVDHLRRAESDDFLVELPRLEGGREALDAIQGYLDRYGMRCVGEIDITRPRWSERPSALLPMILSHVESFEPGESERRFERGRREALEKEGELLERLRAMPDGVRKAAEAKERIDLVRAFIGYREYPKYGMVSRYFVYKQALLGEADRLVLDGVIDETDDVFFLTFHELHEAVRTGSVDRQLIARRREAFKSHQALTPPRVLTSDGEAISGTYRRDDLPPAALVGLAVSAGSVEGRARVILDMAEADIEPGDILVTAFTDPSWSPLFVAIGGLVTEVGGVMTHGAVVAREYGLPAVVGVDRATQRIRDGQRIRVNGTDGYVEVLSAP